MAVLEALSKYNDSHENDEIDLGVNNEPLEDGSPEVYVRPSKEKELDMLWKDFRIPKVERSPIVYLGMGFAAGVITTLLVSACIGMSSGNFHVKSAQKTSAPIAAPVENQGDVTAETSETTEDTTAKDKKFGLFGSSKSSEETATAEATTTQQKEYEVQSGDTMEKIVRQFYGTYSGEKVEAIMNANNMQDANKLSIGQKLIIPVDANTSVE